MVEYKRKSKASKGNTENSFVNQESGRGEQPYQAEPVEMRKKHTDSSLSYLPETNPNKDNSRRSRKQMQNAQAEDQFAGPRPLLASEQFEQ